MSYYNKNMRVLKSKNKNLYKRFKKYEESEAIEFVETEAENVLKKIIDKKNDIEIYIEESKNEDLTMRVEYQDNDIYFHSKYNPTREADRKIEKFKTKNKKQVFALGFGLGYHLQKLASKNKYDKIFIIEPYFSIFYAAINFVDLRGLFKSSNVIYVINEQPSLFDVIRRYYELNLEKDLDFLEQDPSVKLFNDKYKEIYQQIKEAVNYKKTELATNIKSSRQWRNNIIANLPFIFKNPKADDFFGEFEDIPAICVSAGPSLDKNIDKIKEAEGKALIMCVDTALEALIKNDLRPDIVVAMDGHLDKFSDFSSIKELNDIILFLEMGTYYKAPRRWNNKLTFFTMKRNFSGWVEKLNGEYMSIHTGGTVAHSMVDLAYKMGADPIILAGQDLAYANGKTHASGTYKEDRKVENKNLIEVDSVQGNKVITSKKFMTMLSFFENYFAKRSRRKYIDATEGGARIENTEIKTMKEAIQNYCNKNIDINVKELLDNKFKEFKPEFSKEKLDKAVKNLLQELDQAIDLSKKQLSLIGKMESKVKHANNLSDIQSNKFKTELKTIENEIKSLENVKYCTERILIVEAMKYKEVKSKYYINKLKKFKEEIKYYRNYRVKYVEELKKCRNLIKKMYIKTEDREELI